MKDCPGPPVDYIDDAEAFMGTTEYWQLFDSVNRRAKSQAPGDDGSGMLSPSAKQRRRRNGDSTQGRKQTKGKRSRNPEALPDALADAVFDVPSDIPANALTDTPAVAWKKRAKKNECAKGMTKKRAKGMAKKRAREKECAKGITKKRANDMTKKRAKKQVASRTLRPRDSDAQPAEMHTTQFVQSGLSQAALGVAEVRDAPQGHRAHAEVRYNRKNGAVAFKFNSTHFQTTVKAAGSAEAAQIIARACYMKFEEGETKAAVKIFRDASYIRFKAQQLGLKPLGEPVRAEIADVSDDDLPINRLSSVAKQPAHVAAKLTLEAPELPDGKFESASLTCDVQLADGPAKPIVAAPEASEDKYEGAFMLSEGDEEISTTWKPAGSLAPPGATCKARGTLEFLAQPDSPSPFMLTSPMPAPPPPPLLPKPKPLPSRVRPHAPPAWAARPLAPPSFYACGVQPPGFPGCRSHLRGPLMRLKVWNKPRGGL